MSFLIGCTWYFSVVYSIQTMEFIRKLSAKKTAKRNLDVKKDYLDKLGSEQIKKMIERGTQMPVISL